MSKAIKRISNDNPKNGFKGKTITLKSSDTEEKRKEINKKFINGEISLLYVNDINNITNFVYEILK